MFDIKTEHLYLFGLAGLVIMGIMSLYPGINQVDLAKLIASGIVGFIGGGAVVKLSSSA